MEDQYGQQERQQPRTTHCYRHPDRETGVRCTRCERPICPECMIAAAVGFQCPDCVRSGSGTGHAPDANQPRTLAGGVLRENSRLVTLVLLGINLAVFLAVLAEGDDLVAELLLIGHFPPPELFPALHGVAAGEWYRLLTSVFLHEQPWHLGFNMVGLWVLGLPLEAALGRARFAALCLLSGLGGSTLSYLLADPVQGSLGASGMVFGLLGAMAVLTKRTRANPGPVMLVLLVNLVATFTLADIAWQAHIGGLVTGGVVGYAMVYAPRRHRAVVQYGTCAAVLVLLIALCVVRTLQLTG